MVKKNEKNGIRETETTKKSTGNKMANSSPSMLVITANVNGLNK